MYNEFRCPICGHLLGWLSDNDLNELYDVKDSGYVTTYQCINDQCDTLVEITHWENVDEGCEYVC